MEVEVGDAPFRGLADAPVTVIEFSDFRCPHCARVQPTLTRLLERYPEDVRLVFVHYPVVSPDSGRAAIAAVAADWQGRFWEMHDALFALQGQPLTEEAVLAVASDLGMDADRYRQDLFSPDARARIEADTRAARDLGIRGTPSFLINGRLLRGAHPFESFDDAIQLELREKARNRNVP
jgi:protein-disulfide isomerase